jgi:hypothetical protein
MLWLWLSLLATSVKNHKSCERENGKKWHFPRNEIKINENAVRKNMLGKEE